MATGNTNDNRRIILKRANYTRSHFCRRSPGCFQFLSILLWLLLSGSASYAQSDETRVERYPVVDGTAELNVEMDLRDKPLTLEGSWRFAWGEALELGTWEQLTQEMPIFISVPSKWDDLEVSSEMRGESVSGYATYALRLRWQGDHDLALNFDDIESAARVLVSVDGKRSLETFHRGRFSKTPDDEIPINFSTLLVPLRIDRSVRDSNVVHEAIVVFHVSAHHHPRGGIWGVPEVMVLEDAVVTQERKTVQSAMMLGILLIIGFYHLLLTFRRTGQRSGFLFGLFCLSVAMQELVNSGFIPHFGIGRSIDGFVWMVRLEYLVIPAMVVTCAWFMNALVPGRILATALKFFILPTSLVIVGGTLVTAPMVFTNYLDLYELQGVLSIVIVFAHLIASQHELKPWVLLAFGVVALGAINDILYTDNLVQTGYILPYTMIVFVLMQSWLVARNFELARLEREHYYERLLATYKQLEAELETRTELQNENRELYAKNLSAIEDLINAEKLASMGTMAAGVAHDIINPLALAQTVSGLTRDALEDATKVVTEVQETGETKVPVVKLQDLIATLRENEVHRNVAMAKVTEIVTAMRRHVTTHVDPEVVMLRELIDECLLIVSHRIGSCSVEISCDPGARINVKRAQFGQVLMNLIVNSAEELMNFPQEEARELNPTIRITAVVQDEKFGLAVEDNGRGFQQDTSLLGLKPFVTTKAESGGTGLGLTIVKHIIDGHCLMLKGGVSPSLNGAQVLIYSDGFDLAVFDKGYALEA